MPSFQHTSPVNAWNDPPGISQGAEMDSPSGQQPRSGRKSRLKAQRVAPPQPAQPTYNPQNFQQQQQPQQPQPQQQQFGNQAFNQPGHFGNQGPPNQPAMLNPNDPNASYPGQHMFNDPMANMAMQYGQNLASQGTDIVQQKLETYMSTSKLKYYFAVDTSYVVRKLTILLFPFTHTDWSIQYNNDEPVAPRYEINSPDLYIPLMAFVTFILSAGMVLGTHNRFSPEQLGIQASSALGWLIIEILILMLTLYIMNIQSSLKYLDLMALCGYKYVGMILSLLAGLVLGSLGYYLCILYTAMAVAFFLVQTLRVRIVPHTDGGVVTHGLKRRNYLLLTVAALQPFLMWWLTHRIMFG